MGSRLQPRDAGTPSGLQASPPPSGAGPSSRPPSHPSQSAASPTPSDWNPSDWNPSDWGGSRDDAVQGSMMSGLAGDGRPSGDGPGLVGVRIASGPRRVRDGGASGHHQAPHASSSRGSKLRVRVRRAAAAASASSIAPASPDPEREGPGGRACDPPAHDPWGSRPVMVRVPLMGREGIWQRWMGTSAPGGRCGPGCGAGRC